MKNKLFLKCAWQAFVWLILANVALAVITVMGVLSLIHSQESPILHKIIYTLVYILLFYISFKRNKPKENKGIEHREVY